jgi:hypothetical protein
MKLALLAGGPYAGVIFSIKESPAPKLLRLHHPKAPQPEDPESGIPAVEYALTYWEQASRHLVMLTYTFRGELFSAPSLVKGFEDV